MLTQYQINVRLEPWRELDPWARQVPSGHACQNGGACGCKGACGGAGKAAEAASVPGGSAIEMPRSAAEVRAEALAELRGNAGLARLLQPVADTRDARSLQGNMRFQRAIASNDTTQTRQPEPASRSNTRQALQADVHEVTSSLVANQEVPDQLALITAGRFPSGGRRPGRGADGSEFPPAPMGLFNCPDWCPWPDCKTKTGCWGWWCTCEPPPPKPPIVSKLTGTTCPAPTTPEAQAAGICDDEACEIEKFLSAIGAYWKLIKKSGENPNIPWYLKCEMGDTYCTQKCHVCAPKFSLGTLAPCTFECTQECAAPNQCIKAGGQTLCGQPPPPIDAVINAMPACPAGCCSIAFTSTPNGYKPKGAWNCNTAIKSSGACTDLGVDELGLGTGEFVLKTWNCGK